MRVLELFKGSGSIGKYCERKEIEVVSVDIEGKFHATHTADILEWDYRIYPPRHFDILWASPPCTEYSLLLFSHPGRVRDLELADRIVRRVLEIIGYFEPKIWFIENPQTGLLKSREFMRDLPYYDVCYCHYGYSYRKATRIWTNLVGFEPKFCRRDCPSYDKVKKKHQTDMAVQVHSILQRYSIPQPLIEGLFEKAIESITSVS